MNPAASRIRLNRVNRRKKALDRTRMKISSMPGMNERMRLSVEPYFMLMPTPSDARSLVVVT